MFGENTNNLMYLFDSAVFRQLEKLSDLFEKLRVSKIFGDKARRLHKYLSPFCNLSLFVLLQKVEGRVASDQELKLTELLRYYMRDIQAAKVRQRNLLSQESRQFKCIHSTDS